MAKDAAQHLLFGSQDSEARSSSLRQWIRSSGSHPSELPKAECSAAAEGMAICRHEEQSSSFGLLNVTELSLGLKSLSLLPSWEPRWTWTNEDGPSDRHCAPENTLGLMPPPPDRTLDRLPAFRTQDAIGGGDLLDMFPSLTHMSPAIESFSLLNSGSSSPVDSEASVNSCGSDHQIGPQTSPPINPLLRSVQKNLVQPWIRPKEDLSSSLIPTFPAVSESSLDRYWNKTSSWPRCAILESPDHCFSIEKKAQQHRYAAAKNEATCTWEGQLPPRKYKKPIYSCKVFLGGVPWDITEAILLNTFSVFGSLKVEWPGKDGRHHRCPPQGYVYLVFEIETSVKALLQTCNQLCLPPGDYVEYFYKISSKRVRCKNVQVIPWVTSDSNFVNCPTLQLFPSRTVFVGALHGMLNAEALAHIMGQLFGDVAYAGIDTDKHKYPIGSGRVTFKSQQSYLRALSAKFVEIKTNKFRKKAQIDPYLEDSMCQICNCQPGPFFCREQACFKYYCRSCWHWQHSMDTLTSHQPLMRNRRSLNYTF